MSRSICDRNLANECRKDQLMLFVIILAGSQRPRSLAVENGKRSMDFTILFRWTEQRKKQNWSKFVELLAFSVDFRGFIRSDII